MDHNKNWLRFPSILHFCDPIISTRTRRHRAQEARECSQAMLRRDPQRRPSAHELLQMR
jgi:hypothetical protein